MNIEVEGMDGRIEGERRGRHMEGKEARGRKEDVEEAEGGL
jgi:hypothetical protein